MIGAILKVKLLGRVCPCMESEDDEMARKALNSIGEDLPIQWHRKSKPTATAAAGAATAGAGAGDDESGGGGGGGLMGGFVRGIFGSNASNNGSGNSSSSCWNKLECELSITDSFSGPAIHIHNNNSSNSNSNNNSNDNEGAEEESLKKSGIEKVISLKRIGKIEASDSNILTSIVTSTIGSASASGSRSGILIYPKIYPNSTAIDDDNPQPILRFDVMETSKKKNNKRFYASADRRDEIIEKLSVLVDWDRRRRLHSGQTDTNDHQQDQYQDDYEEEYENTSNNTHQQQSSTNNNSTKINHNFASSLGGRAAKAAHFARREIEMKQAKREREQRKTKYLKDSGGLKYTALAMANRATTTN